MPSSTQSLSGSPAKTGAITGVVARDSETNGSRSAKPSAITGVAAKDSEKNGTRSAKPSANKIEWFENSMLRNTHAEPETILEGADDNMSAGSNLNGRMDTGIFELGLVDVWVHLSGGKVFIERVGDSRF